MSFYRKKKSIVLLVIILSCIVLAIVNNIYYKENDNNPTNIINIDTNTMNITDNATNTVGNMINNNGNNSIINLSNIPEYKGNIYIEINGNIPKFTEEDMNIKEPYYSNLVNNRVGMAMIKTNWEKANEDDKKDDYTSIEPSGYKQKLYDKTIVKGGYLYHRSHIIAWKLGGLDKDPRNLMTGTRDFNEKGMKKFEDDIYEYLKRNQQNNVLYRATPYFEGNNKLASRN